ncbi:MAG: hypothetical protein IT494_05195 [Gammaproteobacteria bacterium]|nr:hypothetical protein [Gammaproteobacteria bacterium]
MALRRAQRKRLLHAPADRDHRSTVPAAAETVTKFPWSGLLVRSRSRPPDLRTTMPLPLPLSLLLLGLAVLVAIVLGAGIVPGRRRDAQHRLAQEREARHQIARKAAASVPKAPVREIDLSQSDVISIRGEIDRCIAQERWEEGSKWAMHAIQTQPNQPDFQLKLAEIHCRAGQQREFRALFNELAARLPVTDPRRRKLFALARAVMSDPGATPRP